MLSATHEAFRNLRIADLERYLATLIDSKRFSINDLEPFGLLGRVASLYFALHTFAIESGIWIADDGGIYVHPFSHKFLALCYHTGTALDPEDPALRRPVQLAEGIRQAMAGYIAEHGDGYVFTCGGMLCRNAEREQADRSA